MTEWSPTVEDSLSRLAERMQFLQRDQEIQAAAVTRISDSLQILAVVKMQQDQILSGLAEGRVRMDGLDLRVAAIERELPGLLEVRKWIIGALIASVGLIGVGVLQVTVLGPAQQAAMTKSILQQQHDLKEGTR